MDLAASCAWLLSSILNHRLRIIGVSMECSAGPVGSDYPVALVAMAAFSPSSLSLDSVIEEKWHSWRGLAEMRSD